MLPAVLTKESERALFAALRSSLRVGHWRVACKRYLMLCAVQAALPGSWVDRCEALLEQCSDREKREKQRMLADIEQWTWLLAGAGATHPAVPASVRRLSSRRRRRPAAEPDMSTAIRTHWRPLPKCFLADQ